MAFGKLGALGNGFGRLGASARTQGPPVQYFVNDGAAFPWSNPDICPPHLTAADGKVWLFWEGWKPINGINQQVVECAVWDPTTSRWSGNYLVGVITLGQNGQPAGTIDIHGVPSVVQDSSGYVYVFYGSHQNVPLWIAATVNANDPTSWRGLPGLNQTCTFPKAFSIGTNTIYLFLDTTSVAHPGDTETCWSYFVGTTSSGFITWGSITRITDFDDAGTNTDWFMPGNSIYSGGLVHITGCWSDHASPKQDVYYFLFDPATGNVRNWANTTTVVPASLPITRTFANANGFKIVDQTGGGTFGGQPIFGIDAGGASHFLYGDAAADTSPTTLKHITASGGGAWSSPFSVFTWNNTAPENTDAALVPNASGGMDVYYPDGTKAGIAKLANGSIYRRTRSSGGVWDGSPTLIVAAGSTYGLCSPAVIYNPNPNARVAVTEASADDLTIAGNLKGYLIGDAGIVQRPSGWALIGQTTPATTFDSSNKAPSISLTSNLMEALCTSGVSGSIVRVVRSMPSGKWYIEFQPRLWVGSGGAIGFGFVNASQSLANGQTLGIAGNNSVGFYGTGAVKRNGGTVATWNTFGNNRPGQTIRLALDVGAALFWGAVDNGNWNNSGAANPATGTGGLSISAVSAPYFFACDIESQSSQIINTSGVAGYNYPIPSGFTGT